MQPDMGQNFLLISNFLYVKGPFYIMINPLPGDKILDWSKLKQIADDILKCI